MINNKKAVAIITARGGSKRIPRKNIRLFLGQPIIKYSIDAAMASGCFDEVMVSTDDKEIAEVAVVCGAKVPFMRSAKNSDDHANTVDVMEEVLQEYIKRGDNFDYACCVYPTAPFITGEKINKSMKVLSETNVDSVIPVVRFSYPVQRALKIEQGKLVMIWPENTNARSQDLIPAYHDCGQFYCVGVKRFLEIKKLWTPNTLPVEMPELEVQDIDNDVDWKMAEMKYKIVYDKND